MVSAQIQIHLREIIVAKERIHHLYEIVRARDGDELHEEASKHADANVKIEPIAEQQGGAMGGGARRSVNVRVPRVVRRIVRALKSPRTEPQAEGTGPVGSPLQQNTGCEMVARQPAADADPEEPPLADDAGFEERPTSFTAENQLAIPNRQQSI